MNKIEMLKGGTGLILSVGVGAIVGNLIKSTTPANTRYFTKACISMSALVLGDLLSEKAYNHAEKKIDDTAEQIKGAINKATNKEEEEP